MIQSKQTAALTINTDPGQIASPIAVFVCEGAIIHREDMLMNETRLFFFLSFTIILL